VFDIVILTSVSLDRLATRSPLSYKQFLCDNRVTRILRRTQGTGIITGFTLKFRLRTKAIYIDRYIKPEREVPAKLAVKLYIDSTT